MIEIVSKEGRRKATKPWFETNRKPYCILHNMTVTLIDALVSGKRTFDPDMIPDLLSCIEQLQPYFLNAETRKAASELLAKVVCSKDALSIGQASVLLTFLLSNFEDGESVPSMVRVIEHFVKQDLLASESLEDAVVAALEGMRATGPDARLPVYSLVVSALPRLRCREGAEEQLTLALLYGSRYEKDPQCIFVLFSLLGMLAASHDEESEYLEELFDAAFRYFPITFRSSPKDAIPVTTEELKARLAEVLALPVFSEWLMPRLLEKMTFLTGSTKGDALAVLKKCMTLYEPHKMASFHASLKRILLNTLLGDVDEGIKRLILECIAATKDDLWRKVWIEECVSSLEVDSIKMAPICPLILKATGAGSSEVISRLHAIAQTDSCVFEGIWLSIAVIYESNEDLPMPSDELVEHALGLLGSSHGLNLRILIRVLLAVLMHMPEVSFDILDAFIRLDANDQLVMDDLANAFRQIALTFDSLSEFVQKHAVANSIVRQMAVNDKYLSVLIGMYDGDIDFGSSLCLVGTRVEEFLLRVIQDAIVQQKTSPTLESAIKKIFPGLTSEQQRSCLAIPNSTHIREVLLLCSRPEVLLGLNALDNHLSPLAAASVANKTGRMLDSLNGDALFWTTRALMLCMDDRAAELFDRLGFVDSQSAKLLASPDPGPFLPYFHHVVKDGFLGWFTTGVLEKGRLTAASLAFLASVSDAIIEANLDRLGSLLTESLAEIVDHNQLAVLKVLLKLKPSLFDIPSLLSLLISCQSSTARIRYASLECISVLIPSLSADNRQLAQTNLTSFLRAMMVDKKAVVRDAALRCYHKWISSTIKVDADDEDGLY